MVNTQSKIGKLGCSLSLSLQTQEDDSKKLVVPGQKVRCAVGMLTGIRAKTSGDGDAQHKKQEDNLPLGANRQFGSARRTLWDKSESGSLSQAIEPTGIMTPGSSLASHKPSRTSEEAMACAELTIPSSLELVVLNSV